MAQWQRICLQCRRTWVWSLGQEGSLEKEIATHPSSPAWRIPGREESGELQFMESQRDLATRQQQQQRRRLHNLYSFKY